MPIHPLILLFLFLSLLSKTKTVFAAGCQDKSPYCNSNDCTVRPGYSMIYCRKTCGNCTEFCEDSKYITCSPERKKDCDEMLADYCPKLCARCYSRQLKPKLMDNKVKRTKTIPVSQPNVGMIKSSSTASTSSTHSPSPPSPSTRTVRMKQPRSSLLNGPNNGPRMLPNGTFVSPPIPKYEKLDDFENTEYPVATMEEFIPEPSRIWPEPEPARIQPYQPYSPDMIMGYVQPPQPTYQSLPWSLPSDPQPQQQQLSPVPSSVIATSRRSQPKPSAFLTFLPYPQLNHMRPKYPDHKLNIITIPSEKEDYEEVEDPLGSSMKLVEPFLAPGKIDNPQSLTNLINLLGCKDKDELVCKYVTVETCLSRPGYYLKLCPVTCKNCSGLQCIDSIKINCDEVKSQGACKLSVAQEYCPRTCEYCNPPKGLAENMSDCKDELDTCEQLAESGACEQEFGKSALRLYCAKSCGFCKTSQFYFSDAPLMSSVISAQKLLKQNQNKNNSMTNKIFIHY